MRSSEIYPMEVTEGKRGNGKELKLGSINKIC
jgi:hypothetical protein